MKDLLKDIWTKLCTAANFNINDLHICIFKYLIRNKNEYLSFLGEFFNLWLSNIFFKRLKCNYIVIHFTFSYIHSYGFVQPHALFEQSSVA